jgi:hypothetical protein
MVLLWSVIKKSLQIPKKILYEVEINKDNKTWLSCTRLSHFLVELELKALILVFIVRVVVFNATFYNISVIPWRSILLVDETESAICTSDL